VRPRARIREETMERFTREFDVLFNLTRGLETGGNPAFRCTVDCTDGDWTEHFGAAFVSVDAHVHSAGYEGHVSLMSQSKVVAFMLAIQALGVSKVQQYVSAEPSGRSFGDFTTMGDHRAFNPYVSTGACRQPLRVHRCCRAHTRTCAQYGLCLHPAPVCPQPCPVPACQRASLREAPPMCPQPLGEAPPWQHGSGPAGQWARQRPCGLRVSLLPRSACSLHSSRTGEPHGRRSRVGDCARPRTFTGVRTGGCARARPLTWH
jgi:hypothetical protein